MRHRLLLGTDREHDIILLLLEFQDQLHVRKLVGHAEIDGGSGAHKVQGSGAVAYPCADIFEVEARVFLLKQYSHTFHGSIAAGGILSAGVAPPVFRSRAEQTVERGAFCWKSGFWQC
jgi:hypothetical protein